jgi:hypothetical protein
MQFLRSTFYNTSLAGFEEIIQCVCVTTLSTRTSVQSFLGNINTSWYYLRYICKNTQFVQPPL